jgi:hypothetical protein
MTGLPNAMEVDRVRRDVVEILLAYDIAPPPNADITVTRLTVGERSWSRLMSDQILDGTFPKSGPLEALHFTTRNALPSILRNKELRLASVEKNISEDEYRDFAVENGFASADMDDMKRQLASCLYYTSFSPIGTPAEPNHWNMFALGRGYRLRFYLKPANADLRLMKYSGGEPGLYTRINDEVRQRTGRTLVPWGIARLSAFYLNRKYRDEDEIRLLVANPPGIVDRDGAKHFPIELGTDNPWCKVTLNEVVCGQADDVATVEGLLRSNGFEDVDVSVRPA